MQKKRFVSKKEVSNIFNISQSTVFRWAKNIKSFPKPFSLGPNKVAWDLEEIENYITEKKKVRGFYGHTPRKGK